MSISDAVRAIGQGSSQLADALETGSNVRVDLADIIGGFVNKTT